MTEESAETAKQPSIPEVVDTARKISPIRMMRPGTDTFDDENDVIFSDFRPNVVPSDFPEEEVIIPKDAFAQEPAASEDLAPSSALTASGKPVPPSAVTGATKPNPNVPSSQSFSSLPKNG